MRTYKKYTDECLINYAKEVRSMAELVRKLKLKIAGGTQQHLKKKLIALKIDCSHWTGRLWSKGKALKKIDEYKRASTVKPHLIKIRGHSCEKCKNENWLDSPIMLEIHHVDGNKNNNCPKNLQLLCPNCHATTETWKRKKCRVKAKRKLDSSTISDRL